MLLSYIKMADLDQIIGIQEPKAVQEEAYERAISNLLLSPQITDMDVLEPVKDLPHVQRSIYAAELSARVAFGELDNYFPSDEMKKDVIDTIKVISLCAAVEQDRESHQDQLTKIPNRRALDERCNSKNSNYSLMMIDIDHFKRWNDTYGHYMGDLALCVVAEILADSLRPGEAGADINQMLPRNLPGRYGGEEFYAILPEADSKQAYEVAERVRAAIEEKALGKIITKLYKLKDELGREIAESVETRLRNNDAKLTVSIGVSTASGPDEISLKRQADLALYHSKQEGRNTTTAYQKGMTMPQDH
jgi:diguanylate cyclase (GGDEF)-like protein